MKTSLILGVGGQAGSYLADALLAAGHQVHGLVRHSSGDNLGRIKHLLNDPMFHLHRGDVTDAEKLRQLFDDLNGIDENRLDCVYNMADQDNVDWSYKVPRLSVDVTYGAASAVLEIVKGTNIEVFQPSSATIFKGGTEWCNEDSPVAPRSPYAVAKLAVLHLCRYHREVNGTNVTCGIMFNHDSPRRGKDYLLHRIVDSVREGRPFSGDLEQVVDIGFAGEFMQVVADLMNWKDLSSSDYVIGTGCPVTINHLILRAENLTGRGMHIGNDPEYKRPKQPCLVADCSKIREATGWTAKHDALSVLEMLLEGGM